MNLLDDIRADLVNESASLSNTLRKAKILASQINLPEFRKWLDLELDGYSIDDTIPKYRSFHPTNLGTFSGPFGSIVRNMSIPTYNLSDPVKEFAENLELYDGLGALEGMLSQGSKTLQRNWSPELVILARNETRLDGNMILVEAHQPIPIYFISGIMDTVKNKLLDFLLAIQDSNITPEDLENRTVETTVARTIFNTINVYGDNAMVASGENVNQEIKAIQRGDVDSLLNHFRTLGVDDHSLCELKDAVVSEPSASNGKLGPKVSAWMGGMVTKAATKTWDVGIETASKVLMDALKNYYG